jgi:nucleoside-diphosphate-sugar epimerase
MTLSNRRIAVTGATGFIGRALVEALDRRGASPIAVVRSPHKLGDLRAEARRADLADRDALRRAFEGCDAVLANAGLVSLGTHSREELLRANVEGTRNVLEAACEAGVRRVVMTSSATAYANPRGRVCEEDDPLWPADARVSRALYYAVSKAAAEREAWRIASERGLELTVARPSAVYGPGDRVGLTPWIERLGRVPFVTAFPCWTTVPMVYVDDVAEAMVRMLERDVSRGRAYNVTGDPSVSFWALFRAYREAGGLARSLVLPIPLPFRLAYSNARAERELGFTNRAPVEAFRAMLASSERASARSVRTATHDRDRIAQVR